MSSSEDSIKNIQKNLRKRRLAEIRVQANSLLEPLRSNLDSQTLIHLWIALTCDYVTIILPNANKILALIVADLVDAELLGENPTKEEENGLVPERNKRESTSSIKNIGDFEII